MFLLVSQNETPISEVPSMIYSAEFGDITTPGGQCVKCIALRRDAFMNHHTHRCRDENAMFKMLKVEQIRQRKTSMNCIKRA